MKNYKLEKLKKEQKEKAKPNIKFDNYLKQTKTTEDKVVLLKLKKTILNNHLPKITYYPTKYIVSMLIRSQKTCVN